METLILYAVGAAIFWAGYTVGKWSERHRDLPPESFDGWEKTHSASADEIRTGMRDEIERIEECSKRS